LDERLQMTNEYSINNDFRLETKAQYQFHSLTEVSDDCVPAPGQSTCVKVKDRPAFSLGLNTGTVDVLLHSRTSAHSGTTFGVSGMYQSSSSTGPIFLVPSATTSNFAAFVLNETTVGRLSGLVGLRAETRSLDADANTALSLPAGSRNWSATAANVGGVFRLTPELSLVANYATGWRAPTLFDLYANGPNLAEARYEIGDSTLRTERDFNVEGGARWTSERARAELSVYSNRVDNFIFTSRTAQTINGLHVFRHTQTQARINGAELSADVALSEPLGVHGSYDFTRGTDRTNDLPLELMPPPRAIIGADLHTIHLRWARRASVGASVEIDRKQTHLNPNDVGTDGYTLLNLDFSLDRLVRSVPVRYSLDIRNATNTSYRDFLSRYKEFAFGPGINLIFKASAGAW
jgi:outer membrane receptor protein involved in Fe transport